jgi:hypothetical protein
MEQSELLRFVVVALESLGIPYFITGSVATIFFGEPRFTNDIDIVAALSPHLVDEFCAAFPPSDFYVSNEAARAAVASGTQFNIINPESGLKIDVITPADSSFRREEFGRVVRRRADAELGFDANFASPENVVLMKMQYFQEGGSEKHLRDIAGVLKLARQPIDREYIARWANVMGLTDIWQSIQSGVKGT